METSEGQFQILQKILDRLDSLEEVLTSGKEKAKEAFSLLDNADLCSLLKVDKRTANNYRMKGLIPYVTIGGKVYYRPEDVKDLIERNLVTKRNHQKA